jgi:hypothetical protein
MSEIARVASRWLQADFRPKPLPYTRALSYRTPPSLSEGEGEAELVRRGVG